MPVTSANKTRDGGGTIAVTLPAGSAAFAVLHVNNFLGILQTSGNSAEVRPLNVNVGEIRQFKVPDALNVNKGDTVFVDVNGVNGAPADNDYATSASGMTTPKALFKALAAKDTSGGSGNHFVEGLFLPLGVQ